MSTASNIRLIKTIKFVLFVVSLASSAAAVAADKHINVTVSGNKLVFQNSECPDRPSEMGCVEAEYGNSPVISWELTGTGSDQWQFSGLGFGPTPLQDCTVADFGLSEEDRRTGQASSAQIVANGKRLQIRDENRNQCITQYTLRAVSSGGVQIDSDPIIDNRGGGTH